MRNWKSVKCLVKGTSHSLNGTPCQDYVNFVDDGEMIVAVLADGLGSKRHSEVASQSIVSIVSDFLKTHFDAVSNEENFRKQLIDICRQAIANSASANGQIPSDMDCTLLFAAIRGTEIVAGQLGDGAICILNNNCGQLFCVPQKGSIANSTMSVFSKDAVNSLRIKRYIDTQGIEAIILSSDGLESDFYYPNSKVVRKTAGIYAKAVANETAERATNILLERIRSLQIAGADDDISVAVLARSYANISLPDDPTWLCLCGQRNCVEVTHCLKCQEDFIEVYSEMDFSRKDKIAFFASFNGTEDEQHYIEKKKALRLQAEYEKRTQLQPLIPIEQPIGSSGTPPQCQNPVPNGYENSNREEIKSLNKRMGKKRRIKEPFFVLLLCLICIILGSMASAIGIKMTQPRAEQIDYDKLTQAIYELYQSDRQDNSLRNSSDNTDDDTISSKLDDIYQLLLLLHQNSSIGNSSSLCISINSALYRDLIKDLVDKYGNNGVYSSESSGYVIFQDGSCYIGNIKEGLPQGEGILFHTNGSILIGNFESGKKEGLFLLISECGKVSQISYNNGQDNSLGNLSDNADGDTILSKLDNIHQLLLLMNQNSITGNSASLCAIINSALYRDLIKDSVDKYGNNGVYSSESSGYVIFQDGSCYMGSIKEGLPQGEGILFQTNGSILIGNFESGKKEGLFLLISECGKVSQISYNNE